MQSRLWMRGISNDAKNLRDHTKFLAVIFTQNEQIDATANRWELPLQMNQRPFGSDVFSFTLLDNMAAIVMSRGWVQAALVGCDRVAANGDAANKIGTSGLAVIAKHYGVPLYVHAPLSSIDLACASGKDIPIEERAPEEIAEMWYARRMTPRGVKAFNPAFDVSDHSLITAIVTEKGVVRPPYDRTIPALFR